MDRKKQEWEIAGWYLWRFSTVSDDIVIYIKENVDTVNAWKVMENGGIVKYDKRNTLWRLTYYGRTTRVFKGEIKCV